MNSALTRRRAVPLTFALLIAILAAALTLTTQREAHASGTGHDHGAPGAHSTISCVSSGRTM
jgi:hypothetical protein